MMKISRALLLLIVFNASAVAFAVPPAISEAAEKLPVTKDGSTITVSRGARFPIILDATAGTGYQWIAKNDAGGIVKRVGKSVFLSDTKALPGQSGRELLGFEAISSGSGVLELAYVRPWEKNVAPARVVKVNVTVK